MSRYRKWGAILLVIALVMWNPYSRAVVLWILPLGSGVDDIIAVAAALAGGTFMLFHWLQKQKEVR